MSTPQRRAAASAAIGALTDFLLEAEAGTPRSAGAYLQQLVDEDGVGALAQGYYGLLDLSALLLAMAAERPRPDAARAAQPDRPRAGQRGGRVGGRRRRCRVAACAVRRRPQEYSVGRPCGPRRCSASCAVCGGGGRNAGRCGGRPAAPDGRRRKHPPPTGRDGRPHRLPLVHSGFRRAELSQVGARFGSWQRRAAPRRRPERTRSGRSSTRSSPRRSTPSTPTGLQAQIAAVTPQVARLQGWLTTAAGRLDELTAGSVPDPDTGRPRTVAGWLAQVQHTTASTAGAQLRTARLLRDLPLVTAAVLDGVLTPAQAAVLTRLVGDDGPRRADRVPAPPGPGRRGDGPPPARPVGRPPDRHPLRTRPRRRRQPRPRQALPHPPPRSRREPVRPVPHSRRRQRDAPHRPRTARPQGRRPRLAAPPGNAAPTPSSTSPSRSCATAPCPTPAACARS